MVMPWFLPMAVCIGVLASKAARDYRREHQWSRASRSAWLLVFYGWIPLGAWLFHNLVSHR